MWRNGYATRSRLGTATTGMRSACAMTLAVVTPTRSPVNSPGPMSTAIAASCPSDTSSSPHRYWIAGASCSACRRPPASEHLADHRAVVADGHRHPRGRGIDREHQHVSRVPVRRGRRRVDEGGERVAAHRPRATRGLEGDETVVVARHRPSSRTSSRSTGSSALDPVAPLDDRDRCDRPRARRSRGRGAPGDGRGDRRRRGRAARPAFVLADERERGAHHLLDDAERARDSLREHRLSRRRGHRRARPRHRHAGSCPPAPRARTSPPTSASARPARSCRACTGKRALHVHEVGARLRERGTAVPQDRGTDGAWG